MNLKLFLLSIFLILSIYNISYSQNLKEDFDYGYIENGKYYNAYFKLQISIPKDWFVQNKEQLERMSKAGRNLISGDNETLKKIIKASDVNSVNLLGVFKFEVGAAVDFNPSIIMIGENISNFPGIKNGGDYLFHTKKLLQQSQINYNYIDEKFLLEVFAGKDFYKMNTTLNYAGTKISQIYYSTILNGFSLSVVITYVNDDQRTELTECLQSLIIDN